MNQIDLKGRRAVITGGARGIGLAIAERLVASGAAVALWDRDLAAANAAATALGATGKAMAVAVDQTEDGEVADATARTVAGLGGIDILVNNAGITGGNQKVWEYSVEEWRQVIDVNLVGPFLCCRNVVPEMLNAGYGRIVNIASVAGLDGNPNASHYSASKAGVISLTKSLGKELAATGIRVNAVAPAAVETDIFKQMSQQHIDFMLSKIPMARFGRVEEIAAMVAWLASEDCSFSTGAVFDITGGRATY
ncbi:3-oxoacyl-[acyl-carrier protein] reductase [Stella humosa]|uniref:3-oxoacyl-[acyl-carrier protein] reductase n=1 Tax=Stella humosa TaxID=94 RepID=A0A3N1MCM5_9PROT|nr:SDR family NAD(P)-dependent oxidoreductase [Stella humosa]ROQ01463.1 3-oxoacyl-[acyl-carrier protein] reductase [Stella humosa]BBK31840.1 3-oxoacyl-ACP reductase [Stella humosa]